MAWFGSWPSWPKWMRIEEKTPSYVLRLVGQPGAVEAAFPSADPPPAREHRVKARSSIILCCFDSVHTHRVS